MKRRREKGMVLLLVLVVVALLASLLTEWAFSTLVDLRLTETFRDSTRAYYIAKGGIAVGRSILEEDRNGYDAPDELWAQGVPSYPVGEEGVISIAIEDESGKLDVNRLVQGGVNPHGETRKRFNRLFTNLGLNNPEELTAALIDWMDKETVGRPEVVFTDPDTGAAGAEESYYLGLDNPYPCKNGYLDSLEELALVRGFTADVLREIRPHLTVVPFSTAVTRTGKINVNTATTQVLAAGIEEPGIATPAEAEDAAEAIAAQREVDPIKAITEIQNIPGIDSNLYSRISTANAFDVKGETFRIVARAGVNDGSRTVEAVVEKTQGATKLLYIKVN